jgi:multidrug efflux pump subunit AcrA (membrane-fusion protein)
MLNISKNGKIGDNIEKYSTYKTLSDRPHYKILNKIILGVSILGLIILFLPWTQNISGTGYVTTLKPDQRPQTIHTAIAGRIEKWYVKEGDFVNKGDTILQLGEVKVDYFDPSLIQRTIDQTL